MGERPDYRSIETESFVRELPANKYWIANSVQPLPAWGYPDERGSFTVYYRIIIE